MLIKNTRKRNNSYLLRNQKEKKIFFGQQSSEEETVTLYRKKYSRIKNFFVYDKFEHLLSLTLLLFLSLSHSISLQFIRMCDFFFLVKVFTLINIKKKIIYHIHQHTLRCRCRLLPKKKIYRKVVDFLNYSPLDRKKKNRSTQIATRFLSTIVI